MTLMTRLYTTESAMRPMQYLLLTLALVFAGAYATAQPDNLKFAIGTPYAEVVDALHKEKTIEVLSESETEGIEAVVNAEQKEENVSEKFYTFEFKDGKLNAITINSTYDKLKPAQKAFDDFVNYAASLGAEPHEFFDNGDYKRYILVQQGKPGAVYGFNLKVLQKTAIQLRASLAACVDCPK